MTLRTAVVGGGTVSGIHLSGLSRNPRTELVAVCDVDEERARELAAEWDVEAYFDVEDLVANADLDWLHVCTPVQTHLAVAKTAIEAGIPVQIEKPVTETYEEFEELASIAERHGVTVSVKHNHDFDPAMRAAMAKVDAGELGRVKGVDLIYTGSSLADDPNRGEWNFELSGGEFEEGLPHPIYLTLRAGGYPRDESEIQALTGLFGEYDMPFDYDAAQLSYVSEDGVLCTTKMLGGTKPIWSPRPSRSTTATTSPRRRRARSTTSTAPATACSGRSGTPGRCSGAPVTTAGTSNGSSTPTTTRTTPSRRRSPASARRCPCRSRRPAGPSS